MKNNYEQVVRVICGDDWSGYDKNQDERDGGFGVAMILSYLKGTSAKLTDLSKAIEVPSYLLEMAYKRLQINGLFSPRSWVLNDPLLLNDSEAAMYESLYAWYQIAGMASGFTGKGFTREEYSTIYGENRIS